MVQQRISVSLPEPMQNYRRLDPQECNQSISINQSINQSINVCSITRRSLAGAEMDGGNVRRHRQGAQRTVLPRRSHHTLLQVGGNVVTVWRDFMNNSWTHSPRGHFTNFSRALQNNLAKTYNARNHIYGENFKLKLCTCAQSHALGTRTKSFSLKFVIRSTISAIHKLGENILESSRNVSETTPKSHKAIGNDTLALSSVRAEVSSN